MTIGIMPNNGMPQMLERCYAVPRRIYKMVMADIQQQRLLPLLSPSTSGSRNGYTLPSQLLTLKCFLRYLYLTWYLF